MHDSFAPFTSREIAVSDPLRAVDALDGLPHRFLLHSAFEDARGRWSFFGADPFAIFGPERYDEALALWRSMRRTMIGGSAARPPFIGGLVGCWAYDFGRRLERLPSIARDEVGWPDVWLAGHDVIGAFEHATGRAWLISSGIPAEGAERTRRAQARLDEVTRRFEAGARAATVARAGFAADDEACRGAVPLAARSTFTPGAYRAAVERVRDHIRRGDIFQANLSQRWTLPLAETAAPTAAGGATATNSADATGSGAGARRPGLVARALFESLASVSPAPFAAYLDLGDRAVASASPERFLQVRGRRVETRPIKGTRPRGADPETDAVQRAELLASTKDRAENVMIVDVLRNDLGRVCETGSVSVPELCTLEAFAQVFHLTSAVTGTLRADRDAIDLLHACFPGGSITGAPKIRAMEILESLEPVRRHLYTGAIGYLDWRGDADWNIAIRTAMVTSDAIHFAAGGAITADSDPDAEYLETLAKAEGLRQALSALGTPVELAPDMSRLGAPA